ncbi:Gemini of Cajal bodies-associated protein 8 [Mactra antiquata]
MASFEDNSSNVDMLSQTDTEDTNPGETSGSETSITPSTDTTDSNMGTSVDKQCQRKSLVNVSVDLTEVTDIEENYSSVDDSTSSSNDKLPGPSTSKRTNQPKSYTMDTNWFNQKCFQSYWNHYNQVMSWCSKHVQVYNNLTSKASRTHSTEISKPPRKSVNCNVRYTDTSLNNSFGAYLMNHPYYMNFPYGPRTTNTKPVHSQTQSKRSRRKRKARQRRMKSDHSGTATSETDAGSSEVIEMEVTQEMIDFYAKTMEHRMERDKAKKAEKLESANKPEHVNVENIKITESKAPTIEAPKERPGVRRTAEMKLLYGKNAAMIHGMETALQMTFDRNMDVKQPKIWPNMPLRVIFS